MEALVVLLLAIPALALAGTILGILAVRKVGRLSKRVEDLERIGAMASEHVIVRRVRELERRLRDLAPEEVEIAAPQPPEVEMAALEPEPSPAPPAPPPEPAPELPAPALAEPPSPPTEPPAPETAPPETAPPELPAQPTPPTMPEPTRPAEPPKPTKPTRPRFDWEQLVGVRGAAILGGVVLALAALLFFQYSIEHGLISPTMRVVAGFVTGLGAIFASEWLRKRLQVYAANALAGAGAVILYASIWAARNLYDLIGATPAFVLMVMVTVVCGLLAARHSSLIIAILGLVGGFATPILVTANIDSPSMLFAYVLLLDAGLLWLARQRGWSVLAVLSLAGTALHQALWVFAKMNDERVLLGLCVLAVFAVAFLILGRSKDEEDSFVWRLTRAGGVVIPFAFSLYFAGTVDLGDHLAPVGALLALLTACSVWLAYRQGQPLLAYAAAGFNLGVVATWFFNHAPNVAQSWEAVAVCAVLAVIFQVVVELVGTQRDDDPTSASVALVGAGFLAILAIAAAASNSKILWPWLVGWAAQSAVLIRHAYRPGRVWAQVIAGVIPAVGFFFFVASHGTSPGLPAPTLFLAVIVGVAVAFQVLGLLPGTEARRRWAEYAAASTAVVLQLAVLVVHVDKGADPAVTTATALVLGVLAALAATRASSGVWYAIAVLATALSHGFWTVVHVVDRSGEGFPGEVFLIQAAAVAIFTFWPTLVPRAFSSQRLAWWAAALAGPIWFLSLRAMWLARFGDDIIAALPILLAILSLAAAFLAQRFADKVLTVRGSALVWFLAVSLCFVSLAIPLQLDKQWITIGWALNGLAVLALWRRFDHPGLKYFGLALLAAASIRLVANPAVLGYHAPSAVHVLNWLLYTYLVPAACLIASAVILSRHEVARFRPWEQKLLPGKSSPGAALCGLAGLSVVFVWINLTIADIFSTTNQLTLTFERLPARDLSTSIAWALYALVLLGLGIRLDISSLRWLSLGLVLATIIKVFLHDLGELQDLYRVASLLGLAMSLIMVSLAYQRFVLKKEPLEEE